MKFDRKDLLLYGVTDSRWLKTGETLCGQVEQALLGGATFIQLREKHLDKDRFLEEAMQIQALCRRYRVPFVINDDVEIARSMDADGVHVGQEDMDLQAARAVLGADKIIGVSAHTVEEAVRAEQGGADYLGVGAVFPTGSKADVRALDREMLQAITGAVRIPVVAIGGIGKENVAELAGCGLAGIAVISAIFAQPDVRKAAADLRKRTERMVGL